MREAFICDAVRTPFGRYGGTLAAVRTDDLAALPLKALMERHPHADWGAVDYMLGLKGLRRADDPEGYDRMRRALVHGQSGFPMIGSPDDLAQELARISSAGFDGIGFSFVNYLNELPYFAQEVLPRLRRLGLREAPR